MAQITVTNLTSSDIYLNDSTYAFVRANQKAVFDRALPNLEIMEQLISLQAQSAIDLSISIEPWELDWRNLLKAVDGGYALANETRLIHIPVTTPGRASNAPGQGPSIANYGTTLGLFFDNATDAAYRVLKIDSDFVPGGGGAVGDGSNATLHIHWTKSSDLNQAGATVRWQVEYTVFDGESDEVALVSPTVAIFDDTYDDTGTTTRVVYRTASVPAPGFVSGRYLSAKLSYVSGATTLAGGPVCVAFDLIYRARINV